jgi:alpha-N-arabinofuranosidase
VWALKYAKGDVLDLQVASETYPIKSDGLRPDFAIDDDVPFVDVAATLDAETGNVALFMLNRDLDGEREFEVRWLDPRPTKVLVCETLTGSDLKAFNTFEDPNKVRPQSLDAPQPGATMTFKLPAASYTVCQIATG